MTRKLLLPVSLLLCAGTAMFGATLTVSTGGTYSASVPSTAWTAPSTPWTVTFNVDSNPVVLNSSAGNFTEVAVTNFVYKLNGSTVSVTPVDVAFYSTTQFGLLDIGFFGSSATATPTNGFLIEGSQAYSGAESAPTILSNTYPETENEVFVAGTPFAQTTGNVLISGGVTPTPVPSSWILMLVGLAMGTAYLTSRRFARS